MGLQVRDTEQVEGVGGKSGRACSARTGTRHTTRKDERMSLEEKEAGEGTNASLIFLDFAQCLTACNNGRSVYGARRQYDKMRDVL